MSGEKKEKLPIRVKLPSSKGAVILGDLHIEQDSLQECKNIATEVLKYADKADILIQVGDLCDKNKLNAQELDTLTEIVALWKSKFKEVYILEGNHDKVDNNSSILMYLRFLGVNILDDDVIFELNDRKLRCGHYFVDKSAGAFGHHRMTLEEFKQDTDYGILGHQHDIQQLEPLFWHLGSSRFVSFGENKTYKELAIFYGTHLDFHIIDSCIPMFDISEPKNLEILPRYSKVRYIFKSFKQLQEELEIVDVFKEKFHQLKKHLDFKFESIAHDVKPSNLSAKELINNWLSNFTDEKLKNIIQEEFYKEIK